MPLTTHLSLQYSILLYVIYVILLLAIYNYLEMQSGGTTLMGPP